MLPSTSSCRVEYGTLVQISTFEPLVSCDIIPTIDGNLPRYVVNVSGVYRFKICETRLTDANYYEALCIRIEDNELEDSNWDPRNLEVLVQQARDFIKRLLNTVPQPARLYFDRKHGKMPLDPSDLSFWLGEVLPLNPYTLYKLVPIVNLEERLKVLCGWLEEACSFKGISS
jgi:Lon protease-like protein